MTAEILTGALALVGGGVGSVLGYFATRASTRQEGVQGRREEWGRRFAAALEDVAADEHRRRSLGRTMLVALLSSSLATADDRALAESVLEADALADVKAGNDLRVVIGRDEVDATLIVRDDGDSYEDGEGGRA